MKTAIQAYRDGEFIITPGPMKKSSDLENLKKYLGNKLVPTVDKLGFELSENHYSFALMNPYHILFEIERYEYRIRNPLTNIYKR